MEYETFRFYPLPRSLMSQSHHRKQSLLEVRSMPGPVCVSCQVWLLNAAAIHLCAQMLQFCSLSDYINSNRCALIGMRSPPRAWQVSATGNTSVAPGAVGMSFIPFISFYQRVPPPCNSTGFWPVQFYAFLL